MYPFLHSDKRKNLSLLLNILLMALVYFIAGKLSLSVSSENNIVTIVIFAAEGFALAGVLLLGKHILPGIFLGQIVLALTENLALVPSLGIATVNTLEALIAWRIFNHFGLDRSLQHPKDLFRLFWVIAFVLQPFSAFFGTLVLYLTSVIESSHYLTLLFSWWFGNTLGQMLWTPMLLLLYTQRKKIHPLEFMFSILFFIVLSVFVFMVLPISNLSIIILITLPLTIYFAIKKGMLYASVMIVILSIVSVYATYRQMGIFSSMSLIDNIINLNFYILSHILIVFGVGTLYHEAKNVKEELARLNQSLEAEIKTQVETLNRQNIIMAQQARLASMGEMVGMIAHQWRQPLNSINSNVAVVQMLVKEKLPKAAVIDQKLDNIIKQTDFMSHTIADFSEFFHPDKEALQFNPYQTLQRALRLIEVEAQGVEILFLEHEEMANVGTIYSYENEYLQVILTILHNAIENFNANQIRDPRITFSFHTETEQVSLQISDNGGGIQTEKIEKIFDPYFTTNHSGENSGLGLYMAKLLLEESMSGKLSVTNKEEGASFTITVPRRRDT